ncbi:MAG: hypoxanthine-guanine phosphoribosyltransferase [Gallionellaceae bacterium]|jgi:hypoxanthine phosphoribosyltransferase|nr:hypoxanthine-guanine phosphoribosyltransferase [Gallionellaceae bacterium]
MMTDAEARAALRNAELIRSATEVQAAVARVAQEIDAVLNGACPLVLSVMDGAIVFTGQLLPLLSFPLDLGYVHVSRYGDERQGGALRWKVEPDERVQGRTVLVVDDVLDEGETLAAIKARVLDRGATACYCAVFAEKMTGRPKAARADFVGMELPDRFVFGFGMDLNGAWRNLPEVYAV